LGKKSQNPEKNCRDFLIPKNFVSFFQSNLPLGENVLQLFFFENVSAFVLCPRVTFFPHGKCHTIKNVLTSCNRSLWDGKISNLGFAVLTSLLSLGQYSKSSVGYFAALP
jgi:hypothetical protein